MSDSCVSKACTHWPERMSHTMAFLSHPYKCKVTQSHGCCKDCLQTGMSSSHVTDCLRPVSKGLTPCYSETSFT